MEKKYEFTDETINVYDHILHRIKAIINFGDVKSGNLGGFIEKEENLSHEGNCWVADNAYVLDNASVSGNARLFKYAYITSKEDYICIDNIGSRKGSTTFYKSKDNNIYVICGCFFGTINEFQWKVKETHDDNKYAKEYNLAIEMAKLHILG